MNIKWTILQNDRLIQVKLIYNVYVGSKKLYVDDKEILSLRKMNLIGEIGFRCSDKEYKIQLAPEGYGYTGYIITPDGEKIYPEVKAKASYKTPLWILPFVIVNMAIPIISVEAFTPWFLGIVSSYLSARVAQSPVLNSKMKPVALLAISLSSWAAYYMFYLIAKKSGIHGGFISFK